MQNAGLADSALAEEDDHVLIGRTQGVPNKAQYALATEEANTGGERCKHIGVGNSLWMREARRLLLLARHGASRRQLLLSLNV